MELKMTHMLDEQNFLGGLIMKLDRNKLASLKSFDDHLKEQYGEETNPERKEFEAKSKAWYYAELLKR